MSFQTQMRVLLSLLAVFVMACCSSSDENPASSDVNPPSSVDPVDPVDPEKDEAMSIVEQKEYLEKVGLEFIQKVPSSDFTSLSDKIKSTVELCEDYDWSEVGDWAEELYNSSLTFIGSRTEREEYPGYYYSSLYIYHYDDYVSLLLASNFTGRFTATKGVWKYSKDSVLSFNFTDKKGNQCIVKLETAGNVKQVHIGNLLDYQGYDYSYDYYEYPNVWDYKYDRYYDKTDYTIGIPERIILSYSEGNQVLVKMDLVTDLDKIQGNEFNIGESDLCLQSSLELNNGYDVQGSVTYHGNKDVSAWCVLYKNSQELLTLAMSGNVNNIPSSDASIWLSDESEGDDSDFDNVNGAVKYVKVDILGKVQLMGVLSNVRKFGDYMESAEDNKKNESNFKSYINQANSLIDINLFYDGSSTKQASLKWESFSDSKGWYSEPVICFYDGSSYATLSSFFNEIDFKSFIDAAEDLLEDYEDLFY